MSILSGALQPDAGTMTLDGAPYRPRSPLDARRAGVAMIYQELSLAPHLSVMENIVLGMEPARFGLRAARRDARDRRRDALARLGHPDIAPDAPVGHALGRRRSSSSRSRARSRSAAACSCSTSRRAASAATDARRLFDARARGCKAQGHAIVYISHFIEEVKEVADRFVVLRDGRTPAAGATADAAPRRDRRADGRPAGGRPVSRARRAARARRPRGRGPRPGAARRSRCTAARSLGIAGLLGAGRTRLLRALFGLEPVRAGRVRARRLRRARPRPRERWAQGMGLSARTARTKGWRSACRVADNLTLSRLDGLGPGPLVLPARQDARRARWIERLGIRCARPAPAGRRALGRQPAEGRAGPPAASRRRRAAARRADARHRRRRARRRSTRSIDALVAGRGRAAARRARC